jgi:hypothetical protein
MTMILSYLKCLFVLRRKPPTFGMPTGIKIEFWARNIVTNPVVRMPYTTACSQVFLDTFFNSGRHKLQVLGANQECRFSIRPAGIWMYSL